LSQINDVEIKNSSAIKRLIRKLTYWLYKPMFNQQSEYNRRILDNISGIYSTLEDFGKTQECIAVNIRNLNNEFEIFRTQLNDNNNRINDFENRLNDLNNRANDLTVGINDLRQVKCYLPKSEKPRVIQLVSCLNFGDAVGNEVVAFKKFLQENGYVTEIFTESMSPKLPAGTAQHYRRMPVLEEDDIVIYHFASQCALFDVVKQLNCKIVLRYHNITPPEFFAGYDNNAVNACANGLAQVREIKKYVDYCLPVSDFNKTDLINMGYTCPMTVLPILIRFSDYDQAPDNEVIERYNDGITNILFVGRMAPNKKVEDVISAFAAYKDKYDSSARLFLVGSYNENDGYFQKLREHIEKLNVKDVIFPGHISFAAILAYYSIADIFLCMSEHEGFCVPLVEAMRFETPIVAYSSTAIPSTLSGSGVLLETKDFDEAADAIHNALSNNQKIVEGQNNRLKDFASAVITKQLKEYLENLE